MQFNLEEPTAHFSIQHVCTAASAEALPTQLHATSEHTLCVHKISKHQTMPSNMMRERVCGRHQCCGS